uniref:Uncharacterized protein n=1 Tax=Nelumbo nucifera TaxID=4432 RepID=A0A822Z3J7_NELNU|nr:TPA_asm: hypothetical protein HUJ06_013553 [Nelumbo nucifera]
MPGLVLCIKDDGSDEYMFEVMANSIACQSFSPNTEFFVCIVGGKPSKTKYCLDDSVEIVRLMQS